MPDAGKAPKVDKTEIVRQIATLSNFDKYHIAFLVAEMIGYELVLHGQLERHELLVDELMKQLKGTA